MKEETWEEIKRRAQRVDHLYQERDQKRLGRIWSKSEFLAACATDWGELSEMIMREEGLRPGQVSQEDLEHELSDLLWSLLVLSDRLGIDLGEAFLQQMKDLEERLNSGE